MINRIGVVVPAADEQRTIGACLESLVTAQSNVHCVVEIVVVLDGCTDRTAEIVTRFPDVETIDVAVHNVGTARKIGTAHIMNGEPDPASVLIVSTDADSVVPACWLTALSAQAADSDLILGTVVPGDGLSRAVAYAWADRHRLSDHHPHVHAANLAVRGDVYNAIGGWGQLPTGEDHDLHARVLAAGGRVHATARAPVRTSTRSVGRAPEGFSSYLRALGHR